MGSPVLWFLQANQAWREIALRLYCLCAFRLCGSLLGHLAFLLVLLTTFSFWGGLRILGVNPLS